MAAIAPQTAMAALARSLSLILVSLLILLSSAWAALALWYQGPGAHPAARAIAPALALIAAATVLLRLWGARSATGAVLAYALAFAALLAWWATLQPAQQRDWADDVARIVRGRVEGNVVALENVRHFDWRSDTDYTPRWESRRYDLDRLESVDMALSYWMGPAIAHTLVSFGFGDGHFVTFSVEIRKERHESFSAIAGFFKQYETALIAADERDILRVRTNVRGEDVYLYRIAMPPEAMRSLFLAYLDEADALARAPRFYHTLTANCTTVVYEMARRIVEGLPMDWRLLASGYLPEYLHGVGGLAPGRDLPALRAGGRITGRAQQADRDAGFSRAIRRGVPGIPAEAAP